MTLNYIAIFIASIAQFILGAFWYSPIMFGKWWMQIMEKTNISKDEIKNLQKGMGPCFLIQFLITIIYTVVLSLFLNIILFTPYIIALFLLIGFILPTQISSVIWGNTKKEFWGKQMVVMISNQFVSIMLATWILVIMR